MTWLQAIILGIVEGITEFLPVSSTGHMIVASSLMGIADDDFTKLFEVCVQLGAILSVVVLYWRKFFNFTKWQFYLKLLVAFIPAVVFGLLFSDQIDALLESSLTVGVMLILGGIFMLFLDQIFRSPQIDEEEEITFKRAFFIGFFQVIAMLPGVSRSAATIIGGLQQKLTRRLAAEFSFFLAVPTMAGATAKKLYDYYKGGLSLSSHDINVLIVGNIVAFFVAMIAIKTLIRYVQRHTFREFGVYRIVAGAAVLFLLYAGIIKDPGIEKAKEAQPTAMVSALKIAQ